jgi:hypothetical protein
VVGGWLVVARYELTGRLRRSAFPQDSGHHYGFCPSVFPVRCFRRRSSRVNASRVGVVMPEAAASLVVLRGFDEEEIACRPRDPRLFCRTAKTAKAVGEQ